MDGPATKTRQVPARKTAPPWPICPLSHYASALCGSKFRCGGPGSSRRLLQFRA